MLLDRGALRSAAGTTEGGLVEPLPPLLRGLLRPLRPSAAAGEFGAGEPGAEQPLETGAWRTLLAGLPESQREAALTELMRDDVVAVLGYDGADALPGDRTFEQLGFDSPT